MKRFARTGNGLVRTGALAWVGLALATGPAGAADSESQALHRRALAASCAQCHGTDGHAAPGQALMSLAGRPQAELLALLLAFRSGQQPATVMHQISRGYSPAQLATLAAYFAAQAGKTTR